MDTLLKKRSDAFWADVLNEVGPLQRGVVSRRHDLFYRLMEKHLGQDYSDFSSLKKRVKLSYI